MCDEVVLGQESVNTRIIGTVEVVKYNFSDEESKPLNFGSFSKLHRAGLGSITALKWPNIS